LVQQTGDSPLAHTVSYNMQTNGRRNTEVTGALQCYLCSFYVCTRKPSSSKPEA